MPTAHVLMPILEPFSFERALTLSQAGQRLRGRRRLGVARGQAYRWATQGVIYAGWAGPTLFLPTQRFGRDYLTMPQWIEAFEAARLRMSEPAPPLRKERTDRQATRDHERAASELRKLGMTVPG